MMSQISFENPGVLWGLLLLVVPVLLHLLSFRRFKVVEFSDVALLKSVHDSGVAKKKLREILVLIIRLLLIFFLILAFAKPFELNEGNINNRYLVSVYIDNSLSMSAQDQNLELLSTAKLTADQIIDSYSVNDRFQIITNSDSPESNRIWQKTEAKDLVSKITYESVAKTTTQIYNKQVQVLGNESDFSPQLYWLSDMQSFEELENEQTMQIHAVSITAEKDQNVFIDSVWFDSPAKELRGVQALNVRVRNSSDQNLVDFKVQLDVNGKKYMKSTKVLNDSVAQLVMEYNVPNERDVALKVSVLDSYLGFDNDYYLSYRLPKIISVVTVSDDSEFVNITSRLFQKDSLLSHITVASSELNSNLLSSVDALVLGQLNELNSGLLDLVQAFRKKGGAVLCVPGVALSVSDYKKLGQSIGGFGVIGRDSSQLEIGLIENHGKDQFFEDVFTLQQEEENVKIQMPIVKKRYVLSNENPSLNTVLKLSNGQDYAYYEPGFLVLSSAITKEVSDMYDHPLVVTLFYQFIYKSMLNPDVFYELGVDDYVKVEGDWEVPVQITTPKGVSFVGEYVGGRQNKVWLSSEFNEQGFYKVKSSVDSVEVLSINFNRLESKFEGGVLKRLETYARINNRFKLTVHGEEKIKNLIEDSLNGKQYWKSCLLIALVLLFLEMLFLTVLKSFKLSK